MKKTVKKLIKKGYACFLKASEAILGLDNTKVLDARIRFGRKLNLKNPQTLADKVSYIELHCLPELAIKCTDKWEARKYVAQKGLEDILIPVCADAVSKVEDLDFDKLPEKFVLKATHSCGMNYVCMDKSKADIEKCKDMVSEWLKTRYGTYSVEPHYRGIEPRVYAECCIGKPGELRDYKIHCINGKAEFILTCGEREGSFVIMDIYDLDWNCLNAVQPYKGHVPGTGSVERPKNLEKMIEVAEILSKDFDFVRVDLYDVGDAVYFGELTFTPANGVFASYKPELLKEQGAKLKITK